MTAAPRRTFLKATAISCIAGHSVNKSGSNASADEPAANTKLPDIAIGEVLRTSGQLSQPSVVHEHQRDIPISGHCDVLVCGGGPAGIAAAIRAARSGVRVRLMDVAGCLGGVWTAGLLTKILDAGNKSGLMAELLAAFKQRGSDVASATSGTVYDPELAKLVLEEMCVEAGIQIQLHTRVVGAITNPQNRLTAILTESKSGRQAWTAERFVDCTGDGDLAAHAGCQFDLGVGEQCTCQPMSLMALLTGPLPADIAPFIRESGSDAKPRLLKLMRSAGIDPSYTAPTLRHLHSGIYSIMTNHEFGVSAFDAAAITAATIRARKEVHDIVTGLRTLGGPWAKLSVVATAEQIGVREGRRIRGRYQVTSADMASGLQRNDAVCQVTFPIDVHALTRKDPAVMQSFKVHPVKPYDIPYPALVAADVDGLLMAGRCISGDFIAHSSYRVTGNAVPMGEAAGLAAAQSVRQNVMPHELNWPVESV